MGISGYLGQIIGPHWPHGEVLFGYVLFVSGMQPWNVNNSNAQGSHTQLSLVWEIEGRTTHGCFQK